MTTDILELDKNFNSIITEEKINPTTQYTTYKNANRYKHNDIVYIPNFKLIQEQIVYIKPLPKRYSNITGTAHFKELKDFFQTFNLLQQYLAPHSEDKSLVALDRRYIMKALGNRVHNGNNTFFSECFRLEIKGKEGVYTSGYSITDKGLGLIGKLSKVVHKDKMENIIISIINKTYNEEKIKNIDNIKIKDVPKIVNNSYIEIPKQNIKMLDILDNSFSNIVNNIKRNYIDGKLYYNKSIKPYGRTYSYIHNIKTEARDILFQGMTELDLDSAAPSILLKVYKGDEELKFMKEYVNNKKNIREKLGYELSLSPEEVKHLLQIITFSKKLPTEKQLYHFKALREYPKSIKNEFLMGLSKDFGIIDEYLKENISDKDLKVIKDFKGKVSKIDIRVFTFQNIESKIMERIQSMIGENSFHLHDAVYSDDINDDEMINIEEYMSKIGLNISKDILVYKKYISEFKKSDIKIKSEAKLKKYIEFCITHNQREKILNDKNLSKTSHHHILPDSLFPDYKDIKKKHFWNGSHLLFSDHYYAHWLLTEAVDNYGMLSAFCLMHGGDLKSGRISEKELIPNEEFQEKMEEKSNAHSIFMKTICENGLNKAQNAIAKVDTKILSDNMSKTMTGKVVVKDKDGNKFQVSINDDRYIAGELVGHTKCKFVAKDILGNNFHIDISI